ncbi:MAG: imidazole glycerol phosphate synthase subunit HisH [Balneolales bacterium]
MIAIIDYKAGNLASVSNAFRRLGAEFIITDDITKLNEADAIVFPGVGHAESAMQALGEKGLDKFLKTTDKPVLGICLGMQLFYESTEEGDTDGLGIIPGRLLKFDPAQGKVPHMGWNTIDIQANHPVLEGIESGSYFYHVHSYYAPINEYTLASGEYINSFASIVAYKNYTGVQFHPEKSGKNGEKLLENFLKTLPRETATISTS